MSGFLAHCGEVVGVRAGGVLMSGCKAGRWLDLLASLPKSVIDLYMVLSLWAFLIPSEPHLPSPNVGYNGLSPPKRTFSSLDPGGPSLAPSIGHSLLAGVPGASAGDSPVAHSSLLITDS